MVQIKPVDIQEPIECEPVKRNSALSVRSSSKLGRPRNDVRRESVFELAKLQCTQREMAAVLGVSTDTLSRHFANEIAMGYEQGKEKLRRKQWEMALEKDNVIMLIFLGKQYLGQRDRFDDEGASNNISINILEMPKGS